MMTSTQHDTAPSSTCMLRWVLANGPAAIACEIDSNADRSFDLRVMPLSQPGAGFVEHFSNVTAAMSRHAEIASQLRLDGWRATDHRTA